MTQLDRIKRMNAEEMAEFMYRLKESECKFCEDDAKGVELPFCDGECKRGFVKWLNSEVTE